MGIWLNCLLPNCLTCLDRSRRFEPLGLELGPGEVEGLGEQVEAPHVEQELLHPPIGQLNVVILTHYRKSNIFCLWNYKVSHQLVGLLNMICDVSPSCQAAQPFLPKSHLPKPKQTDGGTAKIKVNPTKVRELMEHLLYVNELHSDLETKEVEKKTISRSLMPKTVWKFIPGHGRGLCGI